MERDWCTAKQCVRLLDVKIIASALRGGAASALVSLQLAGGEGIGEPGTEPCSSPGSPAGAARPRGSHALGGDPVGGSPRPLRGARAAGVAATGPWSPLFSGR